MVSERTFPDGRSGFPNGNQAAGDAAPAGGARLDVPPCEMDHSRGTSVGAVVVGGGIAGLVTAYRLAGAGRAVTLVEAGARLGGQLDTATIGGVPVELGAEALYLAAPALRGLLGDLGLLDQVVPAGPGGTWLATPRGLRRLPAGVGPAGPTRLRPVLRAGLLSPYAMLRAAAEPLASRRPVGPEASVADFVDHRFGRAVTRSFVDPMMGSLHAGDVRRLSLAAAAPLLAAADSGRRSLLSASLLARLPRLSHLPGRQSAGGARPVGPGGGAPLFVSLPGGLATLVATLRREIESAGGQILLGKPVTELRRVSGRWEVVAGDDVRRASAVVLTLPAHAAGTLVRAHAPDAADALARIPYASVATLALAYDSNDLAHHPAYQGTGILTRSDSGRTLKAAVFLSSKWPHVRPPGRAVVRVSVGRARQDTADALSDEALLRAVRADLADLTGLTADPTEVLIRRWPTSMAQLETGHLEIMSRVRAALPGIWYAGAGYDGIGIASCVSSADRAAVAVAAHLTEGDSP